MGYRVRLYAEGDYPHVCLMDRKLFGDYGYSPIFLRQAGELFKEMYYVAVHEDDPIGYIIGAQEANDPDEAWILRIGVVAEWQGQGIGADLIDPLLAYFRMNGAHRVRIALSKRHSPVTELMQSKGFTILSYKESYYYPGIDRMIMALQL
ncbi:GNAT family N-acetyltransferase [Methanocalculus taiwanensis]|uniref:GNAT family N-acetyltransferase n=1 Tax=Methanocalculus taiwanensis TaxID=106207 RepID=A0ABD4THX3_9EURY|nr:GNAT family N-acetyltransferase [Methanocalculus taiwanensis]MCQ1538543.1 GNAT family N-acetyltransferase [Methanocalculus taiwanensis]